MWSSVCPWMGGQWRRWPWNPQEDGEKKGGRGKEEEGKGRRGRYKRRERKKGKTKGGEEEEEEGRGIYIRNAM